MPYLSSVGFCLIVQQSLFACSSILQSQAFASRSPGWILSIYRLKSLFLWCSFIPTSVFIVIKEVCGELLGMGSELLV